MLSAAGAKEMKNTASELKDVRGTNLRCEQHPPLRTALIRRKRRLLWLARSARIPGDCDERLDVLLLFRHPT
jgi:hypothetical protein